MSLVDPALIPYVPLPFPIQATRQVPERSMTRILISWLLSIPATIVGIPVGLLAGFLAGMVILTVSPDDAMSLGQDEAPYFHFAYASLPALTAGLAAVLVVLLGARLNRDDRRLTAGFAYLNGCALLVAMCVTGSPDDVSGSLLFRFFPIACGAAALVAVVWFTRPKGDLSPIATPTFRESRDSGGRLSFSIGIEADLYAELVGRVAREFDLSPDGERDVGLDEMIQNFKRRDARIALEWDNWTWFTVVARDPESEALAREIATFLVSSLPTPKDDADA